MLHISEKVVYSKRKRTHANNAAAFFMMIPPEFFAPRCFCYHYHIGINSRESLMSEFRERLLAVEANRLSGKAGISIGDLNIDLNRIIDDVQDDSQ